ncbi:hypothetical protein DRO69_03015 [Candidatus Bathyarchaeota archaeon]|nr:MAG: hypothetical protein DRO69_03015 [Candidatus Bathyarchaeota archaeon]
MSVFDIFNSFDAGMFMFSVLHPKKEETTRAFTKYQSSCISEEKVTPAIFAPKSRIGEKSLEDK